MIVPSCESCNTKANRMIDQPMLHDPELSRLRAQAGVLDQRTGEPTIYREVIDAADGKRALLYWSEPGPKDAKFLPVPIERPDGDPDIFMDLDFVAAYETAEQERAGRDGIEVGEPYEPDPSLLEHPPGSKVTVLMTTPEHDVPLWLWPSLVARIALGTMRRGLLAGLIEEEPRQRTRLSSGGLRVD